jgi:hypothetical protein
VIVNAFLVEKLERNGARLLRGKDLPVEPKVGLLVTARRLGEERNVLRFGEASDWEPEQE